MLRRIVIKFFTCAERSHCGASCFVKNVFDSYQFPEHMTRSEDLPFYTWALGEFTVTGIEQPTVKINKHSDSLRHSNHSIDDASLMINELSNLPFKNINKKNYLIMVNNYRGINLLSLFRSHYLAKDYIKARHFYHQALKCNSLHIFKVSYLRKYLLSYFKH